MTHTHTHKILQHLLKIMFPILYTYARYSFIYYKCNSYYLLVLLGEFVFLRDLLIFSFIKKRECRRFKFLRATPTHTHRMKNKKKKIRISFFCLLHSNKFNMIHLNNLLHFRNPLRPSLSIFTTFCKNECDFPLLSQGRYLRWNYSWKRPGEKIASVTQPVDPAFIRIG